MTKIDALEKRLAALEELSRKRNVKLGVIQTDKFPTKEAYEAEYTRMLNEGYNQFLIVNVIKIEGNCSNTSL
jgi:hypothetical protein